MLPTGDQASAARRRPGPTSFASLAEFADFAAGLGRRRDPRRLAIRLRWNARQLPDGRWTWKYDPALRAPLRSTNLDDVWAALRAYSGPVLFVRAGERSHLTDEAAERVRAVPGVQIVVVPNAGHNVMGDNPQAFRREIDQFLAGQSAGRPDTPDDGRDRFRSVVADAGQEQRLLGT